MFRQVKQHLATFGSGREVKEHKPKKNRQNGATLKRHCKPAFTKQVLPRFSRPHTPTTGSRNSATFEKATNT